MFAAILVPLDGSAVAEGAIPYAQALLPEGGHVLLLRVLPVPELLLTELLWTLDSTPDGFAATEVDAALAALEAVKTRFADTGAAWESRVERGDPATHILETIARSKIDLVAMTTHGRGAIGRTVFGSVADRVSRESPAPVLLVRPRGDGPPEPALIRRIVVPLDGSPLAEGALPIAAAAAKQVHAPLHLVRAIDLAGLLAPLTDAGIPSVGMSPATYDQIVASIRGEVREYLESTVARLAGQEVTATWAVLDGSPFFAIADATKTGDLLVMTSHGRSGALRWVLGSVAEKLVREAPAPILLMPTASRGDAVGRG